MIYLIIVLLAGLGWIFAHIYRLNKLHMMNRIEELKREGLLVTLVEAQNLRGVKRIVEVRYELREYWIIIDERQPAFDVVRYRVNGARLIHPPITLDEAESLAHQMNCTLEKIFYPWKGSMPVK